MKTKILLFSFTLYVVMGLDRTIIGPLIPLISEDLNVGFDMIGLAISLSALGLLVTGLTTSLVVRLIGPRNVILLGIIIIMANCLGFYFSYSYTLFLISNILLGLGVGILSVITMSLIASSYKKNRVNQLFKIAIGFSVGIMLAPLIVGGVLYLGIGWRNIFVIMLVPQVLLIVYLFFLRIPNCISSNALKSFLRINKNIITNKFFFICLIIIFTHGAVTNTFTTWFTSYFKSLNIELNISSLFMTGYSLAMFIGMILKHFALKIIDEKRLLLITSVGSFLSLILAFMIDSLLLKNILIFIFGLNIAGTFTLAFSLGTIVDSVNTDSISSFLHSSQYFAIIIFQYLVGMISEKYSTESIFYVNIFLVLVMMIAVIVIYRSDYENKKLKINFNLFKKPDS